MFFVLFVGETKPNSSLSSFVLPLVISCILTLLLISFMVSRLIINQRRQEISSSNDMLVPKQRVIEREARVYQGNFTQVWRGTCDKKNAAIKLLSTQAGLNCWNTEKNIYTSFDLNNENVVKFLCAEEREDFLPYDHILVTEYAEHGSLFKYLRTVPKVNFQLALKLMLSFLQGLAFLHRTTPNKPIIAHRDLKSQNVLVKAGDICCIADFGLAVPFEDSDGQNVLIPKTQVCILLANLNFFNP